jgi:hypothetical protein
VPGGQGEAAEAAAGEPPAAAVKAGELVGTNFERKYRAEGRGFHATTLRLVAPDAPKPA